jgi:hypothetical protein
VEQIKEATQDAAYLIPYRSIDPAGSQGPPCLKFTSVDVQKVSAVIFDRDNPQVTQKVIGRIVAPRDKVHLLVVLQSENDVGGSSPAKNAPAATEKRVQRKSAPATRRSNNTRAKRTPTKPPSPEAKKILSKLNLPVDELSARRAAPRTDEPARPIQVPPAGSKIQLHFSGMYMVRDRKLFNIKDKDKPPVEMQIVKVDQSDQERED